MLPNCKICQEPFKNGHPYKSHKVTVQNYFRQYFPKTDLSTGEQLKFASPESWLLNDFNNKNNLKNYLKKLSLAEKQKYCIDLIKKRKELKELKYSLSEVETKSLLFPSVQYMDILFKDLGGYYKICEDLGLVNKFIPFAQIKKEDFSGIKIKKVICDSREQEGLELKGLEEEVQALNYGDYTSKLPDNFIYIDRKSATDFLGTIGKNGLERFQREIERAFLDGNYLIMLVEYDLGKMLGFNKTPFLSRHTKATPEFIFSNLRFLCQSYSNFQPVFVSSREEASRIIPLILSDQKIYSKIDIQLLYSVGLL